MPAVFHSYFTTNDKLHDYDTRHKDDIHGRTVKTTHGQHMVKHAGPAIWNSLPGFLKEVCSVRTFRKNFKLIGTAHIA